MSLLAESVSGAEYAGFWRRLAAFILDGIGLGIVGIALNQVLGLALGTLLNLLIFFAYFSYFESSGYQATPGKLILRITVTDLDGNRLTLARAIGRTAAKFLSSVILGIGYLMAAFTPRKQALHDIFANTLVGRRLTAK